MQKKLDEQKPLWQRLKDDLKVFSNTPRVLRLVWKAHPVLASFLLISITIGGLTPLVEMWMMKSIIDALVSIIGTNADPGRVQAVQHALIFWLFMLATVMLLNNAVEPTSTALKEQLGDHLTRSIGLMILEKANSFPDLIMFENPKYHDMLQKAQNESTYRPIMILTAAMSCGQATISGVSMLVVLVAFQPLLAIAILALATPHLFWQVKHQRESWAIQDWEIPEVRRMRYFSSILTDKPDAKEIRVFDLGQYFLGRYLQMFKQFQERHANLRKRHWRNNLTLALVAALGNVGAYAYIIFTAFQRTISIGSLSLYLSAVGQINSNIHLLVWSLSTMFEGNLFIRNLFAFLELKPTMELPKVDSAKDPPEILQTGIQFNSVCFKYPDNERMILDNISFNIPAGKTVALVGENGAGKTTIVKLLSRLYDPTDGTITVDGIDVKELNLQKWRATTGVVFQDYSRFHLYGRENIGLGRVEHIEDKELVVAAAKRGGAAPVLERLANGYETMLGRRYQEEQNELDQSADLSNGEWQKVALSRAFMRSMNGAIEATRAEPADASGNGSQASGATGDKSDEIAAEKAFENLVDAQVLILDEPTSALDAQAEYDIFLRFHQLTAGKTTLLISHRFSTVRMADIVLVLEKGKIIEEGNHRELMQLNGEYARLYNLQADRYKDSIADIV